mmetsp:Transcript_7677/g.12435  ORF Transcript_7677/g.12435 Transcript_7677/m.12435 type:complete len:251 (-) Transcript_7677:272-1024(-)
MPPLISSIRCTTCNNNSNMCSWIQPRQHENSSTTSNTTERSCQRAAPTTCLMQTPVNNSSCPNPPRPSFGCHRTTSIPAASPAAVTNRPVVRRLPLPRDLPTPPPEAAPRASAAVPPAATTRETARIPRRRTTISLSTSTTCAPGRTVDPPSWYATSPTSTRNKCCSRNSPWPITVQRRWTFSICPSTSRTSAIGDMHSLTSWIIRTFLHSWTSTIVGGGSDSTAIRFATLRTRGSRARRPCSRGLRIRR